MPSIEEFKYEIILPQIVPPGDDARVYEDPQEWRLDFIENGVMPSGDTVVEYAGCYMVFPVSSRYIDQLYRGSPRRYVMGLVIRNLARDFGPKWLEVAAAQEDPTDSVGDVCRLLDSVKVYRLEIEKSLPVQGEKGKTLYRLPESLLGAAV